LYKLKDGIINMKTYIWFDGSGRIEIPFTQEQIDSICHSGSNDAAVASESKPAIDPALLKSVLSEYGAWDDIELSNHADNLERVFWIAAWDCFENSELFAEG
jgi:hypothetical protein